MNKKLSSSESATKVIIDEKQHPVPVVLTAPDGVTPVPIPELGVDANTSPGADTPVAGYIPDTVVSAPTSSTPTTGTPVNVTVIAPSTPATVIKGEGVTLSPTTTEQQDVIMQGQRDINKIWENTQSWIALMVVTAGVVINGGIVGAIIFWGKEVSVTQLALMTISLQFINLTVGIVIGFYFSRTNHSAQGGVGPKVADAPYTGR